MQVAWRADLFLDDPRTPTAARATRRMEAAFARFVEMGGVPLERWSIPLPADGPERPAGALPAWVSSGITDANRALLILGGGDTYVEDLWFFGGRAAVEAGWPVVLVDLPGQGATPDQGLHFGPRTLDGLFAVFDELHARGFAGEVVLLGWSGGGVFTTKYATVARAEDRVVALVASTPVHDVRAMFERALPALLRDPDSRLARLALRAARGNRVLASALAKYEWQFGPGGIVGVLDFLGSLGRADLTALDVPVLALVGRGEAPEGLRQARAVVDAVRPRHPASRIETFDAWSGGDAHCQVGNLPRAMSRVFDWLAELPPSPSS